MIKNLRVTVNGNAYDVQVEELDSVRTPQITNVQPAAKPVAKPAEKPAAKPAPIVSAAEKIVAPMPGNILAVNVKPGDSIKAGTVMMILEAMKMENEIMAPRDLTIAVVHVSRGDKVESGDTLVSFN